jgi:hypothetical protein
LLREIKKYTIVGRKFLELIMMAWSIHEMIVYKDLGFSPRGRAKEDIEAGTFTLSGNYLSMPMAD